MELVKCKLQNLGGSLGIIVPKEISKKTINHGFDYQWVVFVDCERFPSNEQILRFIFRNSKNKKKCKNEQ